MLLYNGPTFVSSYLFKLRWTSPCNELRGCSVLSYQSYCKQDTAGDIMGSLLRSSLRRSCVWVSRLFIGRRKECLWLVNFYTMIDSINLRLIPPKLFYEQCTCSTLKLEEVAAAFMNWQRTNVSQTFRDSFKFSFSCSVFIFGRNFYPGLGFFAISDPGSNKKKRR